jgi:CheY-like chemotaxis protein
MVRTASWIMSMSVVEYILVVDDQPEILSVIGDVLEYHGYLTFCTDDPNEALRFADDNKVSVLLTDIVMPGMNGEELARRMLSRHPEIKVLLMTGYAEHCPKYPTLYKPFRMDVLRARLQTL